MVQAYNLMYAGAHDIEALPPRSNKTKQETSDVYKQERREMIRKILGYKDCCKVDCNIIMPPAWGRLPWYCCQQNVWGGTTSPACRACSPKSIPTMGLVSSNPEVTSGFLLYCSSSNGYLLWLLKHYRPSPGRTRHPGPPWMRALILRLPLK